MTAHPNALWLDLALLWSRALVLASDSAVPWPVRGRAASLCRALAFEIGADDALALRAVDAASTCAESFPVAHDLLIAAREVAVDDQCIIAPMLELCRIARAAAHHDTVVVALLELLELDSFCDDVPAARLPAARSVDGEANYWLRRLVRRWVEALGADHERVRAVIRERADVWFAIHRFRLDVLRAMHSSEPTSACWVVEACRDGQRAARAGVRRPARGRGDDAPQGAAPNGAGSDARGLEGWLGGLTQ